MKERDEDRECQEAPVRPSQQSDHPESARLPNKLPHPKGVFRFRSFEEFNEWKEKFGVEKIPQDPT
jgi:hypothetical protein